MFETETEAESIERVIAALTATFPLIPMGEIRDCVAAIHQRFADATVRTYVPVLVDRRARWALMCLPSPGPAVEAVVTGG